MILDPEVEDTLFQLFRYLIKHRPSESWSAHLDARGQIFSQRWPGRVPTGVYVRMKEDAELAHPSTR